MKRRKGRPQPEDQYGDVGGSQDRDEVLAAIRQFNAQRGSPGGPRIQRSAEGMVYTGQVPKFVRDLEKRLGYKRKQGELTPSDNTPSSDDASNDLESEAPPPDVEWMPGTLKTKAELAEEAKEKGNTAFRDGDFDTAIKHYTEATELNPSLSVYFSNRSSAYARQKRFAEALEDAEITRRLSPEWPRGWARLGEAHYGLEQFSDAADTYRKALAIEPGSITYTEALAKCLDAEKRQMEAGKHKFKKSRKAKGASPASSKKSKAAKTRKVKISYDDAESQA